MAGDVSVALIAGSSGVLGAVVGAVGATFLEGKRIRAAHKDSIFTRRLKETRAFTQSGAAWSSFVSDAVAEYQATGDKPSQEIIEQASKIRQEHDTSYVTLLMDCSEPTFRLMQEQYVPVLQELDDVLGYGLSSNSDKVTPRINEFKSVLGDVLQRFRYDHDIH